MEGAGLLHGKQQPVGPFAEEFLPAVVHKDDSGHCFHGHSPHSLF